MKKIIFYIGSMQYGGANRVVSNLLDYLGKKKYALILLNDILPSTVKEEYAISKNVKRYFLNNNRKNKILKNITVIASIRKIVKNEKPDMIISFMGPPNIRMILSTLGLKVKRIISVRNDPYQEYGCGLKKVVSKIILNMADGCVFQTSDAKRYFAKKLQRKSKIILNPVNQIFYKTKRSNKVKNIISVGRLEKQKNHKLLIDSYIKIYDRIKGDKLIIYGEGSLRSELENYINSNNMNDSILLPGVKNNIWKELSKSKIFVLPSNYEGMPNALMEAMAVGVPVIATDCPCGGPKELIKNDKQGLLVECNDINKLSEAILRLTQDEKLLSNMSKEIKNRALDFKPEIIYKKWENYINEVLEK